MPTTETLIYDSHGRQRESYSTLIAIIVLWAIYNIMERNQLSAHSIACKTCEAAGLRVTNSGVDFKKGNVVSLNGSTSTNDDSVKTCVAKHPDVIVIVHASWCPHCVSLLKNIEENDQSGFQILLADSEKLSNECLRELNVTHFPCIIRHGKQWNSLEECKAEDTKNVNDTTSATTGASAKVATLAEDATNLWEEPNNESCDAFASLF